MSSDTPPLETADDIQVRLKPLFGLEPKHYLAGIYSAILVAALFALLVLPGITSPGTKVTITSSPPGASVSWGKKHWGVTPVTVFLPQGEGELVVSKPGFVPSTRSFVSGSNLFLSLLLPRTDAVDCTLAVVSAEALSSMTRQEVGLWALSVPFTSEYRFPPLFTRFILDAKAAHWDEPKARSFLLSLREAVADPQMYQDYGAALGLWTASPPESLEAQFSLWKPLSGDSSDRLALWILANQSKPVRDRETTEPSDWFQGRKDGFASTLKSVVASSGTPPAALRSAQGTFRGVASTTYLWGSSGSSVTLPTEPPYTLPVPVTINAFWISDSEVTGSQFAAFVAANPKWAPTARDNLTQAGLADADYLPGWTDGKPSIPTAPVSSVSWYAAQAYVDWVNSSGQVPSGKRAVLPDDLQWEAAARSAGGASMLNQGVWEWTSSAWYPGQALVWNAAPAFEPEAYARSLKGGVQSTKGSVKPADRAGWPAKGATPGLGFRLALVGSP